MRNGPMRPVNELNKITPNKNIWKIYVHVNIYIYYILCISASSSWTELLLWQTYSLGHRGQNLSTTKERWDSFHFYPAKPRLPPEPDHVGQLGWSHHALFKLSEIVKNTFGGILIDLFFLLPPSRTLHKMCPNVRGSEVCLHRCS